MTTNTVSPLSITPEQFSNAVYDSVTALEKELREFPPEMKRLAGYVAAHVIHGVAMSLGSAQGQEPIAFSKATKELTTAAIKEEYDIKEQA